MQRRNRPHIHPPPLHRTVLDTWYAELAPAAQTFHCLTGAVTLYDGIEAEPLAMHLARALTWCIRTPRAPTYDPIRITLSTAGTEEIWVCQLPRHTVRSTLSLHRGYFTEWLGAVHPFLSLEVNHAVLHMRLEGLHLLGVPYPAWLRLTVSAEESGDGDRFYSNTRASLPLLGVAAAYQGYFDLMTMEHKRSSHAMRTACRAVAPSSFCCGLTDKACYASCPYRTKPGGSCPRRSAWARMTWILCSSCETVVCGVKVPPSCASCTRLTGHGA